MRHCYECNVITMNKNLIKLFFQCIQNHQSRQIMSKLYDPERIKTDKRKMIFVNKLAQTSNRLDSHKTYYMCAQSCCQMSTDISENYLPSSQHNLTTSIYFCTKNYIEQTM